VIREDLEQWYLLEEWNGTAPWRDAQHTQMTLYTDASLDGYGAILRPGFDFSRACAPGSQRTSPGSRPERLNGP